jgi:hypothetical protein
MNLDDVFLEKEAIAADIKDQLRKSMAGYGYLISKFEKDFCLRHDWRNKGNRHKNTLTHIYTYTHIHIHTNTHTHSHNTHNTHIHIHAHTQTWLFGKAPLVGA